jgi:hypothetical protein
MIDSIAQLPDCTFLIDPGTAFFSRQAHAAKPEDGEFIAGFWDFPVEHGDFLY